MTSTRVAAHLAALITISLGHGALAKDDDLACCKLGVYDDGSAGLMVAKGHLMGVADSRATITQLDAAFASYLGDLKDLPEHEVVQKKVMLSAVEQFSLDSVRACTGRSAERLEKVVAMVDLECWEYL
jgi:hypothetical protein